ncbi:MAG: TonB-dependent receptor, partial [Steroidobacteraceae bacterium]
AGLLFTPNDKFDWYVTADYTIDHSSQVGGRNVTFPFTGDPAETYTVPGAATYTCALYGHCDPSRNPYGTTRANNTDGNDSGFYGVMSDLNYNFGPARLTSVSGYRRMNHRVNEDVDTEAETIFSAINDRIHSTVLSQELRLSSVANAGWDFGGRLDWVVGLYYFNVEFDQDYHFIALDTPLVAVGGIPITQLQNGETTSSAAFAHLIYNLTDQWSISAGGRQTHDKKDHSFRTSSFPPGAPFEDESESWNNFSYDLGTQFKLNDVQMIYVRYATGYRGGGFVDNPDFPEDATEYDPEKVKYWEVGLKADWFDRRLRTNILAFYGDYTDLQRSSSIPANNPQGFKQVIDNAADATSKGVELEMTAVPIPQLTLRENVGYLKNKYDTYVADIGFGLQDLSKADFQQSPKWTSYTSATYDYTLPGIGTEAHANIAYSWHSKQLVYSVPSPLAYQRKLGLLDASLDFDLDHDARMQLSIWGRNLTDERYQAFSSIITVGYLRVDGLPRTYGASLSIKF